MASLQTELFVALQRLLPQHSLSRLTAKLADARTPWLKNLLIKQFVRHYGVDLSEAVYSEPEQYDCFNAFFTRQLQPDARPIAPEANALACPADGTVSQMGGLVNNQLIQAKGKTFSAATLLGSETDADAFTSGQFATIYLSPKDYHRVHMPIDGTLKKTRYIPGQLFSVNNATAQEIPELFARNERLVCFFDTDIGEVAIVLVGAMLVAGIGTVWCPQYQPAPGYVVEQTFDGDDAISLKKGEELGLFNFGSTVIMLFEPDQLDWENKFSAGQTTRMGEKLAVISN